MFRRTGKGISGWVLLLIFLIGFGAMFLFPYVYCNLLGGNCGP